jgi:hypothetical protein
VTALADLLEEAGASVALLDRARRTPPAGRGDHRDHEVRVAARLLSEVLADRVVAERAASQALEAARPVPRLWQPRRRLVVVGLPLAAAATGAAVGLPPRACDIEPRGLLELPREVLVLAAEPTAALGEVWAARIRGGGARSWVEFLSAWSARGRLAPRADAAAVAARWARRGTAVHVAVGDAEIGGLKAPVRTVRPVRPQPSFAAYRVLLRINPVLRILLDADGQDEARALVLPHIDAAAGPPPPLPPRRREWIQRQAHGVHDRLLAGDYALHGDPGELLGVPDAAVRHGAGDPWDNDPVLEIFTRVLLAVDGEPEKEKHRKEGE